jgi:hypothetical protein
MECFKTESYCTISYFYFGSEKARNLFSLANIYGGALEKKLTLENLLAWEKWAGAI